MLKIGSLESVWNWRKLFDFNNLIAYEQKNLNSLIATKVKALWIDVIAFSVEMRIGKHFNIDSGY